MNGLDRPQTRERRLLLLGSLAAAAIGGGPAHAANAGDIAARSRDALAKLLAANGKAKAIAAKAYATLVFPEIVKAGALVGGLTGEGAMFQGRAVKGFYRLSAVSYGLQLGAQRYGYALFFMNEAALSYLSKSGGWSVGTGPSFVVVDEGYARSMTTTTLTQDVYALPFNQRGLMAGGGIEGARIRQIYPEA